MARRRARSSIQAAIAFEPWPAVLVGQRRSARSSSAMLAGGMKRIGVAERPAELRAPAARRPCVLPEPATPMMTIAGGCAAHELSRAQRASSARHGRRIPCAWPTASSRRRCGPGASGSGRRARRTAPRPAPPPRSRPGWSSGLRRNRRHGRNSRRDRRPGQRRRRQIEQPGGDDAAAPPDLGDVGDIEIEACSAGRVGGLALLAGCRSLRRRPASCRTRCRCGSS